MPSPPSSPTSEPPAERELAQSPSTTSDEKQRGHQAAADEATAPTDWQALLLSLGGQSSMFEDTPEEFLGEQFRQGPEAVVVAPFMSSEMKAMWAPSNAGWVPSRPVSPPRQEQEKERLYYQQQLQQQQDEYYHYQQQQLQLQQQQQQQQQQYYMYQQQQLQLQQQQQQMLMMPPSPVAAQQHFQVAASA
jgi:hypothetical protein